MKFRGFTFLILSLIFAGCNSSESDSFSDSIATAPTAKQLFVASGSCYGGGVTVATGSSTIVAYDLNGQFDHVVVDYNRFSPGDQPISMLEYDDETLLVLVENTSGRRLDLVLKNGTLALSYLTNTTALSAVMRAMARQPDRGILVSKSTAIEKFSASKGRILQGVNPYISAPAGSCATTATLITSLAVSTSGKIIYSHSAATPNNKLVVISDVGYGVAGNCLAAQAAPSTLSMPTSLLFHSSGDLLAAYGSTTAASNLIYSYAFNDTTGVISSGVQALFDLSISSGTSAMAENTDDGTVFIANGSFNAIEKLSYDSTTKQLSLAGNSPFIAPQIYTRCVTSMLVVSP